MNSDVIPYRSMLYMPGSNARALDKARSLPADSLILDLEDAVSRPMKETARDLVCDAVRAGGYGMRRVLIRINGLDTPWGAADLEAAVAAGPDGVLLPKVEKPEHIRTTAARIAALAPDRDMRVWAMMETPLGVLNAAAIASADPALEGFVMGTNDLLMDLQAAASANRSALLAGLGHCLLAARAHGLICIDGVFNAFKDANGLRAECEQGRILGFDGKSLIHPAQINIANEVFGPKPDTLAQAERQVQAFEEAEASGKGVAVVDGRIVENLHAAAARRLIAKASAIARLG